MKKEMFLIVLLLSGLVLFGQSKNFIDQNYIELTGKAEMKVEPDIFILSIVLSEANSKDRISLDTLEQRLFRVLIQNNISIDQDLKVKNLNSYFQNFKYRKEMIILRKQYELTVREAKKLFSLFPALEKAGISNARIIRLEHSKMETFREEVRALAIQDAKRKAKVYAQAIGQKVGRALLIEELGAPQPYQARPMMMKARGMDSNERYEPDMEFTDIKFSQSVRVHFALN